MLKGCKTLSIKTHRILFTGFFHEIDTSFFSPILFPELLIHRVVIPVQFARSVSGSQNVLISAFSTKELSTCHLTGRGWSLERSQNPNAFHGWNTNFANLTKNVLASGQSGR